MLNACIGQRLQRGARRSLAQSKKPKHILHRQRRQVKRRDAVGQHRCGRNHIVPLPQPLANRIGGFSVA